MSGFLVMVGVGVAMGLAQALHDDWFADGWEDTMNAEAAKTGLPPATHRKRRWGRIVGVMAIDPETGKWLWRSER